MKADVDAAIVRICAAIHRRLISIIVVDGSI